ncbi:probable phosphoglycerate mutase [Friedmanniella luteola]|uniref:Probable phosphoglycerate mutase n=1 Tax=Friedmanniella luteola TaxID=546871 RepID=A0A1H1XQL8_9ACTN|nr:histidine phosphatase family protein [Friedmanniella luteola]SDT11503.1 probable phosphoglycerate mutase [Friedmanniella luteola]
MTASRIIVWRHGRTPWNVENRFQGQADIGLDDVGREQAARAAAALAVLEPAVLWASDLSRARDTAGALADLTGLPVTTDRRLREIHVGSWEGLLGEDVERVDPEASRRLRAGEDVRRSATGESPTEVGLRVAEALRDLADAAPDGSTVVAASHGLAGRVGVAELVGLPPEHRRLLGGLTNCAWVSVDRHRSGRYWRIEQYNATALEPSDPLEDRLDFATRVAAG